MHLGILAVLYVLAATGLSGAEVRNTSYSLPDGDRVIRHEVTVPAPPLEVWNAWTTPEKMRGFIAPVIALDLRIGGLWESSYNPAAKIGDPENIHNRVLAYVPGELLVIQIAKTPSSFPAQAQAKSVWTVVRFEPVKSGFTRVIVQMLPYKRGPEWDQVYRIFEAGNGIVLERLHTFFTSGPIDWAKASRQPEKTP